MRPSHKHRCWLVLSLALACAPATSTFGQTATDGLAATDGLVAPIPAGRVSAADFSPAFLGMYRKIMAIDEDISTYARKYDVDPQLARAVCMFESGVNPEVTSAAGAHGYFQVMPSTFRLMGVPSNIEAGIKYLSQLTKQFKREDYALAAYNGGPGRVARGRAMPLESLQYVLGVGYYRSVLKMHEPEVREYASALGLTRSLKGDDWDTLSRRLNVPPVYLRLYNPLVTEARLRRGLFQIAYPTGPVAELFSIAEDGRLQYRSRIGDNYINLAFALGVDVDRLRDANGLWRLQVLPAQMLLTIPSVTADTVRADEPAPAVEPAADIQDAPAAARPAVRLAVSPPAVKTHIVRRGDTLTELARRYGTSIAAIQRANGLGRRTTIRVGERLRIPQ